MTDMQLREAASSSEAAGTAEGEAFEHDGRWYFEGPGDEPVLGPYDTQQRADQAKKTVDWYMRAVELLEERGHESSYLTRYSGRAMYGSTCPAIVSDASAVTVAWAVITAMCELGEDGEPIRVEDINPRDLPTRSDNMGRTAMVYY